MVCLQLAAPQTGLALTPLGGWMDGWMGWDGIDYDLAAAVLGMLLRPLKATLGPLLHHGRLTPILHAGMPGMTPSSIAPLHLTRHCQSIELLKPLQAAEAFMPITRERVRHDDRHIDMPAIPSMP